MWKLFIFTCVVYLIKETQTSSVNETVSEYTARSIEKMEKSTEETIRRIHTVIETFQRKSNNINSKVHNITSEIDMKRREFEEKESSDLKQFTNITTCKGIKKKYNFDFNETKLCLRIHQYESESLSNHFEINGNKFIDEIKDIKIEAFKKLRSETLDSLVQAEEIVQGAYKNIKKAEENFPEYLPSEILLKASQYRRLLEILKRIDRVCDPSEYMTTTKKEMSRYIRSINKCLNTKTEPKRMHEKNNNATLKLVSRLGLDFDD